MYEVCICVKTIFNNICTYLYIRKVGRDIDSYNIIGVKCLAESCRLAPNV